MNTLLIIFFWYIVPVIIAIPIIKVYNKHKHTHYHKIPPGMMFLSWGFVLILIIALLYEYFIESGRWARFFNYD